MWDVEGNRYIDFGAGIVVFTAMSSVSYPLTITDKILAERLDAFENMFKRLID
jgi:4-aminobutyrate aminotransferase-like enzyme